MAYVSLAMPSGPWGTGMGAPELPLRAGPRRGSRSQAAALGSNRLFWPQVWVCQVSTQVECSQAQVRARRRRRGP